MSIYNRIRYAWDCGNESFARSLEAKLAQAIQPHIDQYNEGLISASELHTFIVWAGSQPSAQFNEGFTAYSEIASFEGERRTLFIEVGADDRITEIMDIIAFSDEAREPPMVWDDMQRNLEWHWGQ